MKRIIQIWWPLAASWVLMGAEMPALSAVVARLPDAEINLAAYGGIVYPLALIIEAPIIMLLAASTALCKDWISYHKVWRFMMSAGASLTALHMLVAFTPLYDVVAGKLLGVPQEIIEPGRIGLMIMTPWTWSIAYRRFNQGVLIRFGRSQAVGVGTIIRLSANFVVLLIGFFTKGFSGIVIASTAVACGVVSEAIFVGIVVRPVLKCELRRAAPVEPVINLRTFLDFYIPLALTSLLSLLANPIGSAAISRMPDALASLAVWPVITGLIFMLRSLGIAFNEVVVALLDEVHSTRNLRLFAFWLAGSMSLLITVMAATPLSIFWFRDLSALSPRLVELARIGLWIALPLPAFSALQSWYQGAILHGRKTNGITESVLLYLLVSLVSLGAGIWMGNITGLYVGLGSLGLSTAAQTAWLWLRSREPVRAVTQRDDLLLRGNDQAHDQVR